MISRAVSVLAAVRTAGGKVALTDGRLKLTAPMPLPTELVERLREAKAEMLALLTHASALEDQAQRGAAAYARWLETAEAGEGAP